MATDHLVPSDIRERYHVKEWRNAAAVLTTASPVEWQDILEVLRGFTLLRSEVVVGGGNRSLISRRIDGAFYERGWVEKGFETSIHVDATVMTALRMQSIATRRAWPSKWNGTTKTPSSIAI